MVLLYVSRMRPGAVCLKGHCKPGTDPKRSIGCDCPGSYQPSPRPAAPARRDDSGPQQQPQEVPRDAR